MQFLKTNINSKWQTERKSYLSEDCLGFCTTSYHRGDGITANILLMIPKVPQMEKSQASHSEQAKAQTPTSKIICQSRFTDAYFFRVSMGRDE